MTTNSLVLNPPFVFRFLFLLKRRFSLKTFLVLSFFIIIACLVVYVFQVNAEASERYLIKEQERELSSLLRDNQKLEINLVGSSSLDNIMSLIAGLNFEKVGKIHYIKVTGNQMVTRPGSVAE